MIYLVLYIATIFGANWAIATFGFIPVWPGLLAPAGVLFVGASFTLRDLTQERLGKGAVLGAVVVGAALSALVSPQFALASGASFLLSEFADFAVYTPLARRRLVAAVVASSTAGLIVDSVVFLWLAFGSLEFLLGQIVGKLWMVLIAVPFVAYLRRRDERLGLKAA